VSAGHIFSKYKFGLVSELCLREKQIAYCGLKVKFGIFLPEQDRVDQFEWRGVRPIGFSEHGISGFVYPYFV
jgi:hypothetical protein